MFKIIMSSIRNKLLLAVASACLLVAIALAVALVSLSGISKSFREFVEQDQAGLQAYSRMYAQGLQGGQALRNIVLNPSLDKRGLENLEKSYKDFDDAFKIATSLAQSDKALGAVTADIGEKWKITLQARERVLKIASTNQTEAIKLLNDDETPAWRLTRELLLRTIAELESAALATSERISDKARTSLLLSIAICLVAVLIGTLLVLFVMENFKRSLDGVTSSMLELTAGEGDLTRRLPVNSQDEVGRIAEAFNRFMEQLQGIIRQIHANGDELTSSAAGLTLTAEQVADSSHKQSDAASSTAAAVEEMTVSIASIADAAATMRKLSDTSLQCTQEGNVRMSQLIGEIDSVESAVNEIAKSVNVFVQSARQITSMTLQVKEIADQTNLLALNAAIEAARAGEQGRGFAVVADEVRKLAEKSAKSADDIDKVTQTLGEQSSAVENSIESSRQSLLRSQDFLENVAVGLGEVNNSVSNANQSVDEISRSIAEQKSSSTEIAQNIERIARMSEENSMVIAKTSSTAHSQEQLATKLHALVSRFKI